MISGETVILDPSGLHARPASRLVEIASEFESDITITSQGKTADGKKVLSIMMAGIKCGAAVTITCNGPDEKEALLVLLEKIHGGLDKE